MDVRELKDISIYDYLISRGISLSKEGNKFVCSSPLSNDSTPSFYYYPVTNTFYDFANGVGGDIIKLVSEMESVNFVEAIKLLKGGKFDKAVREEKEEIKKEAFNLNRYISYSRPNNILIRRYAIYRGIIKNYVNATYILKAKDEYVRKYGLGFVLVDENLSPCGIKIRDISPTNGRRFFAKGDQKFYIIEQGEPVTAYIVESETSANSLAEYLKRVRDNFVVVCFGSWNNIREELPFKYEGIKDKRLIIDFDGNKELYEKRIARFEGLKCSNITLELKKGEDINSLYVTGLLNNYKQILI